MSCGGCAGGTTKHTVRRPDGTVKVYATAGEARAAANAQPGASYVALKR